MSRILGLDVQTLLQMGLILFNVLLTIYIIYRIMYKPVLNFLAKRTERIQNQLNAAANAQKEAEALRTEYEEKLSNIEKERFELLDSARKRGQEKETQIVQEAKTEAETIRNRAALEIKREEEKAKDEMKKQIIEISTLMASRFVTANIDEETQNKLLDEVVSDLGDVKWQS